MRKKKFEFDEVVNISEKQVKNIDVYNLEVEDDNSYCANRLVVHNCITEMSYAMNNGYMTSVSEANRKKGKKTYFVYSGGVDRGTCKFCEAALGTVLLWSDKPLGDDKIKDVHSTTAIWRGKNNVGRKPWWICFPTHPNCIHYPEEIDPVLEKWDEEINKIIFKVD